MSKLNEGHKKVISDAWKAKGYQVEFTSEEVIISKKGIILEKRSNEEVANFLENAFTATKK